MKSIHLKLDEKMFYKMKKDKLKREIKLGHKLSWEEYSKILFGFRK
jgi:hypothetical protein